MTTRTSGLFCLSVDCTEQDAVTLEVVRRHSELADLLNELQVPSTWTSELAELPRQSELCPVLPRGLDHRETVLFLRNAMARAAGAGRHVEAIVADPCQVRSCWELLARRGISVVRPQSAKSLRAGADVQLRGGLVVAPISCSFVGGARRTVKSLLRVCQRQLVAAAKQRNLFQVHVDLGPQRASWPEELDGLRTLILSAYHECGEHALQFRQLSQLKRRSVGARGAASILRAA